MVAALGSHSSVHCRVAYTMSWPFPPPLGDEPPRLPDAALKIVVIAYVFAVIGVILYLALA